MGEAQRRKKQGNYPDQTPRSEPEQQYRVDPETYSKIWEKESLHFAEQGMYKLLSEFTPPGNVLEIGSGIGVSTVELAVTRKVLAIDNNVHLVEKARARITVANAKAEILFCDVLAPSAESTATIIEFAPVSIVGWCIGSNADDQENHTSSDLSPQERAKDYREKIEDAIFSDGICPPSVEWVHLVFRGALDTSFTAAEAKKSQKDNYDEYVFLPNGFETSEVQLLSWDPTGSTFQYGWVKHPKMNASKAVETVISILAKRQPPATIQE